MLVNAYIMLAKLISTDILPLATYKYLKRHPYELPTNLDAYSRGTQNANNTKFTTQITTELILIPKKISPYLRTTLRRSVYGILSVNIVFA